MKKKTLCSILTVLFVLISCSKHESLSVQGDEQTFHLKLIPDLENVQTPLTRQTSAGLYAINVLRRESNSWEPYATGLFNDVSDISIGLVPGYEYKFDCTFVPQHQLPYKEGDRYGLPFSLSAEKKVDGIVTNKLTVSLGNFATNTNFHQYIYSGAMQVDADTILSHPSVERCFGSVLVDFRNPQQNPNPQVPLVLRRTYYSLSFSCDALKAGYTVRVEPEDMEPITLQGIDENTTIKSEEKIFSMKTPSTINRAEPFSEESIPVKVFLQKADSETWENIIATNIVLTRNKRNKVNLVNVDKYYSNASVRFETISDGENIIHLDTTK